MQSLAGGAKRLTYRIGPFNIIPGQNSIDYAPITQRPQVDGYITRIRPEPHLSRRHACRGSTSSTCTTACG